MEKAESQPRLLALLRSAAARLFAVGGADRVGSRSHLLTAACALCVRSALFWKSPLCSRYHWARSLMVSPWRFV